MTEMVLDALRIGGAVLCLVLAVALLRLAWIVLVWPRRRLLEWSGLTEDDVQDLRRRLRR